MLVHVVKRRTMSGKRWGAWCVVALQLNLGNLAGQSLPAQPRGIGGRSGLRSRGDRCQ